MDLKIYIQQINYTPYYAGAMLFLPFRQTKDVFKETRIRLELLKENFESAPAYHIRLHINRVQKGLDNDLILVLNKPRIQHGVDCKVLGRK